MTKRSDRVRFAGVADAVSLADLHIRSWQVAYRHILPAGYLDGLDREDRTTFWQNFIGEGRLVLVLDVGETVGFCFPTKANEADWGEISSIYVHPEHWGKGYGSLLLAAGEDELRDMGFERALLWVLEENWDARAFYEAKGWGLSKRFQLLEIGGTSVTEVRYEKTLEPDV